MSESLDAASGSAAASHAGALIRSARQARGWSLGHVAVLLKLTERRLQAFEEGRWSEVGDATFVRALTRSLCRHLGVDADHVMAALPPELSRSPAPRPLLPSVRGDTRREGLGDPSPLRGEVIGGGGRLTKPVWVAAALILGAAAVLGLLPYIEALHPVSPAVATGPVAPVADAPAPAASTAALSASAAAPSAAAPGPAASGPAASAPATSAPATSGPGGSGPDGSLAPATAPSAVPSPSPASGALIIRASQPSWISVQDAKGQSLLSRIVVSGEQVELDGARPLSVRVGNAAGTEVRWKGSIVDLQPLQRSNVATFDLP